LLFEGAEQDFDLILGFDRLFGSQQGIGSKEPDVAYKSFVVDAVNHAFWRRLKWKSYSIEICLHLAE